MIKVLSAVGTVLGSIVYAVSDIFCSEFFLIDIGDYDAIESVLPAEAKVRGVFITHGHHDHVLGLNRLIDAFPDCRVYGSEECAKMLRSAKANLSFYVGCPFEYKGDVHLLRDGDKVELFNSIILTVMSTPGHNPSCLSFEIDDYLFTGDSYIPGVSVVTNLPGGNRLKAQESMLRIIENSQGKTICPGHYLEYSNIQKGLLI